MSRVFRVTPKRVKRTNGTVLTPEMEVTVTTQSHTSDPFYNGAKENGIKVGFYHFFSPLYKVKSKNKLLEYRQKQ